MHPSPSPRPLALAALLVGLLWLLTAAIAFRDPAYIEPRTPLDHLAVWSLSLALGVLPWPLWALHRLQAPRDGFLGYQATVATGLGSVAAAVGSLIVAGVVPGTADAGDLGAVVYLTGIVLLILGLLPLGVATLRARALPRWMGGFLLAGCPLMILSEQGGLVAFGLGWLAVGTHLGLFPPAQAAP
jgi:hypothetical protein